MSNEHIYTGSTVEEAIETGLAELSLREDQVDIEVLDEPSRKLFGLAGSTVARVQIIEKSDAVNERDEDTPAKDTIPAENRADASELSDEQIDTVADAAIETIKEIATLCELTDISVEEYEGDEGELILDILGPNLGIFIGRHGRTVDALQVVVSAIATKKSGVHYPVVVDVEGYKHRRKQKVVEIATRTAERVKKAGRPVALRPMTPQERRQVHMAIRDISGVDTKSDGVGAYRHVIIVPKR